MLNIISVFCIANGATIMTINIVKYYKIVKRANYLKNKNQYYKLNAQVFALILMCFFLIGYIFNGFYIFLSKSDTSHDLMIALVYLFGAIFVDIMINAQKQIVKVYTKEVLGTVTNNINSMIHVVDPKTFEILFVNTTLAEKVEKRTEDLVGKTCWKELKKDKTEPCSNCPAKELLQNESGLLKSYQWENFDEFTGKTLFTTSSNVSWVDGRQVLMCNAIDITERKEYEKNLKIAATVDELTGTYNRKWGHQTLDKIFSNKRQGDLPFTFCFFDLDDFKRINDNFGHDTGDIHLKEFAKCVSSMTRKNDMLIRWGGDEFLLVLDCNLDVAKKVIEKIQNSVDEINREKEAEKKIEFSYGLQLVNETVYEVGWEELVKKADEEMYKQKMMKK